MISILPVENIPLITSKDDLSAIICKSIRENGPELMDGDVVCVAQKIVFKAEGKQVKLEDVTPSEEAKALARECDKDPRLVELVIRESSEILRCKPGILIVRHRLGHVGANAGIDQSNVDHSDGPSALLLPDDPDESAQQLRLSLEKDFGCSLSVVVIDSNNRPWRLGTIGQAIGVSGFDPVIDNCGSHDLFGRELKVSTTNLADTIATAATLVTGETTEALPVVVVRGVDVERKFVSNRTANRSPELDLFC